MIMRRLFLYIPFIMLSFTFFAQGKDYYEFLGVQRNASASQIKKAYFKFTKEYHPDGHPDEVEKYTKKFELLGLVYGILSDPVKRKKYDYYLDQQGKISLNWGNLKMLEEVCDFMTRNSDLYYMISVVQEVETGRFRDEVVEGLMQKVPVYEKVSRRKSVSELEKLYLKLLRVVENRIRELKIREEQRMQEEFRKQENQKRQIQETIKLLNLEKDKHPMYMDINTINNAVQLIAGQSDEALKDEYLGELYQWRIFFLEYRDAQAGKLPRWNELIKLINQVNDEYTRNINNLGAINLSNVERVIAAIESEQNWYFKQTLEEHLKRFKVLRDYLRKIKGSSTKIFI